MDHSIPGLPCRKSGSVSENPSLGHRILSAIRAGSAPRPAKLAGARGALPLTPGELLEVQILLAWDEDREIAQAAEESLGTVAPETATLLAADPETSLDVLGWLAGQPDRWPAASRILAGLRKLPIDASRTLARSQDPETLEILAQNHDLIAADPELGHLLLDNSFLAQGPRGRLLDFHDELAKLRVPPTAEAETAPFLEEAPAAPPARDPFLASLGIDAEVEAMLPDLDLDIGQLAERSELLGELEEGDDAALFARISRMNVGQKLRLALFGSREIRSLLVRDSNRIVAAAVIKNPKFTANEAESVCNSRNVSSDILRMVARHREFSKLYSVQHNLVRNPRCPLEISLGYVSGLNDHDLRLLMKNRNISDGIRRQVKKTLEVREARRRVRIGPGKH